MLGVIYINDLSYFDIKVLASLATNNLKVKPTAEQLHFCRHSIVYHINKIKKITGLNPLNFCDLYKLLFRYNLLYLGEDGELVILDEDSNRIDKQEN